MGRTGAAVVGSGDGIGAKHGDAGEAVAADPGGAPPGDAGTDRPTSDTPDAASWLRGALAAARRHARDGSWLHDPNRLTALAQLDAMARCLAARDRRP